MGKSLLELLADKATIPRQPGNAVPLTNATRNTIIPNSIGEVVKKLVGEQGLQREEANLVQVKNFVKNIPKIYGTDSVRILTQSDPHKKKVAIKKVAGAIGGVLGPIGKAVGKFAADFNPKFPDDFLEGSEEEKNLSFSRYNDLYASNYANGKYYNGGIKNSKTALGKFLQANKTPGQLKDAAIGTAKSLAVGLAIAGVKTLFSKKKKTQEVIDNPYAPRRVRFPSAFAANATKADSPNTFQFDNNEKVALYQNQQSGSKGWPSGFGSEMKTITTGSAELLQKETLSDELINLNTIYSNFNARSKERTNQYALYLHGIEDAKDKRVGTYSNDVLRIFTPEDKIKYEPASWTSYSNNIKGYDEQANFVNIIPIQPSLLYGGNNSSTDKLRPSNDVSEAYKVNKLDDKSVIFNTISYKTISGTEQVIRYNKAGDSGSYSKNVAEINMVFNSDFGESSGSYLQTQAKSETKTPKINPYLVTKTNLLADSGSNIEGTDVDSKYDYIKVVIGNISVLGTITGLTDNTTPSWTDVKAVGSGFKFYLYDSWEREISFKFQMYAENKKQLDQIWKKAERIKTLTLPTSKQELGVFGRIVPLVIGDLINVPYGFLTACNMAVLDISPWEIDDKFQKPFVYEMDITYKVVSNDTEYKHYN
jgi:hypothetical protein